MTISTHEIKMESAGNGATTTDKQSHVEDIDNKMVTPEMNEEMSLTVWQTIKANPKAIMYSLLAAFGPMCYGFDLIIISLSVAMPSFRASYGQQVGKTFIIPAIWLALWNSMIQVGGMAGSLVTGPIADRMGRRFTFIMGTAIAATGIFIVYFSDKPSNRNDRRIMFLMGKIVVGFSFGFINTSFVTYVSEIAPTRVRGPLLSCFTFFTLVGQLIGVSLVFVELPVTTSVGYHRVFASQWAIVGAAFIAGLCLPESPVYLIKREKLEKALRAYKRIFSRNNAEAGLAELQTVVEHEVMQEQNNEGTNFMQCFKGTNWRRTRIVIWANIMQQFVGVAMLTNSTYFLELGGMAATLALELNIIHIAIGLPFLTVAFFGMTMLGRRTLLLTGTTTIALLWLTIGIAGCFQNNKAFLFIGVCLIIVYEAYSLTISSVYPVVSGEASSMQLRASSQSIGFFSMFIFSWLFQFTVPYMFAVDAGNLGGKVGFIFCFFSLLGFVIVWFEIPETKNRTYAELDEMFEKRIPTRQFKNYVCSGITVPYKKEEEAGV